MFAKPCFLQWFLLFYFSFFRPLSSIFVLRRFGLLLLYPFRVRGVEICKIASSFSIAKHRAGQNRLSISSRRFAISYFRFFTPPSYFSFFFVVVTVSRERCRHLQNRIFIFYCKTQGEPKWLLRFVETICDFLFSFFHPS